jgi:hypothetical protein
VLNGEVQRCAIGARLPAGNNRDFSPIHHGVWLETLERRHV